MTRVLSKLEKKGLIQRDRDILKIIDVEALADALDSGHVAGAGLDVLPDEPPASDLRLLGRDNVILTPHVGFYSEDSIVDLQTLTAQQVAAVIRGERPEFAVNSPA